MKTDKSKNKTSSVTFRVNDQMKQKLLYVLEKEERVFSKWFRNVSRKEIERFEKENGPIKLD